MGGGTSIGRLMAEVTEARESASNQLLLAVFGGFGAAVFSGVLLLVFVLHPSGVRLGDLKVAASVAFLATIAVIVFTIRGVRKFNCVVIPALLDRMEREQAFITAFRPTDAVIRSALALIARQILEAHKAKSEFHQTGLSDKESWNDDPEDDLTNLKTRSRSRENQLERAVTDLIEKYRWLRDLARSQGYEVPDSWKSYTDLAPAKPEPVFAEGMNEQPGQ